MITFCFVVYLVLIFAIGWAAWRRTLDIGDYLLGGRRVSAWVAALSAGASDMSGWLLLGLPGLAVYAAGAAAWTAIGLLLGTWANWQWVAAPLREHSARLEALTLPEFFARRFPAEAGRLRLLSALCVLVFFLLYTSAGLVAGGKLFSSVFDLAYPTAVVLGASVILLYTMFGGFLAVAWTDALQALLMSAALGVVATLLWHDEKFASVSAAPPFDGPTGLTLVVSALAWGLGYFGQPHILARFMAIQGLAGIPRARRIATTWTGFGLLAAVAIGIGGAHLVANGADPERVFIVAIDALLPPWLAGICLAAILAAIMSTADSQLLVTSSALAEDLLPRLSAHALTTRARLSAGRVAVAIVCVLATLLALDPDRAVLGLVARAWAGFGASFGPALLIALYRGDACGRGALAGMVTGALSVGLWPLLPGTGYGVYELLPAFCLATVANLAVNRLAPAWTSEQRVETRG